ncbi:MAG: TIGR04014 family B12-binding domain/radical SAM domain-containing protein [Methanoregulaceae archaeon]|jgi:B12-binding domain/radical SAM domain protein|nr:TIGR04014 family B12-binding domain/radical SAM domain-containing protein [Methanoregulaceae archaeon]MCU0629394.1 TIGR04014 family B12-binding domain/radical SAM domain-containing protein [Methanoregulaceae archaeon]
MQVQVISPGIYTYGAMVVGGILKEAGHIVTLHRELVSRPGDAVFLSLFSTQHLIDEKIRSFITDAQKTGKRCYIGGPVSAAPDMVLGELSPDAVVVGEGEGVVLPLLLNGPEGIPGTAYRKNGKIVRIPRDPPGTISRPLPLIPDDIASQDIRGANVYIETHRGCLGACTFCQVPRFFGRSIRSRDIGEILEEVRAFHHKGARRISVSGGTGSLYQYRNGKMDPDAFINLLSGLAGIMGSRNVSAPDIRVDCISDEILYAIKRYTIGWVFFGIESGSDRILAQMGKGVTTAQVADAIASCRQHGLAVAGSFIVGYPTETEDDYDLTKEFIAGHPLDDIFVSVAEPIPSTPLASLTIGIPKEKNPLYISHTGEYRPLGLTEAEARFFDLTLHAAMCRTRPVIIAGQSYDAYLGEARKQGRDIRAVTELLYKYYRE